MMGKKQEVAKNILLALGMVGLVGTIMIAPGLAKALPLISKIDTRRILQEVSRLKKKGLVEVIKKKNGVEALSLTKSGKDKIKKFRMDDLVIEEPPNWDGKWRIIIFDISVKKNYKRELLRRKMEQIGFYKLQNSVFAHPYPCFEVVNFIRDYFDVSEEVEYMEVGKLESQNKLIGYFFA